MAARRHLGHRQVDEPIPSGGDLPGLIVLDTMTAAGCPRDTGDISAWWDRTIADTAWAAQDAEVSMLLLDHEPKSNVSESKKAPVGSGDKVARSDLVLRLGGEWCGPSWRGASFLTVIKDLEGITNVPHGRQMAVINTAMSGPELTVAIEAPADATYTERARAWIELHPGGSGADIVAGTGAKKGAMLEAIQELADAGIIQNRGSKSRPEWCMN